MTQSNFLSRIQDPLKQHLNNPRFWNAYLPACLFVCSFVWKYCYIELRDIAMDEPFTIFLSQQSVSDIWNLSLNGEPNPPFFTLLLHFWVKLFGIDANIVRLVPLFFNSLTIVFVYKTAQKVSGNTAALCASILLLVSSTHFYFALETRTYSLVSCCAASVLYFYVSLQENHKSTFVGLFISNLILVYSHYFGWFILFNEFVFAFIFFRNKQMIIKLLSNITLVFVAYAPITLAVVKQFQKSSQGTWVQPPYEGQLMHEIWRWLNTQGTLFWVYIIVGLGLALKGWLFWSNRNTEGVNQKKYVLLMFVWFLLPFSIMYGLSFSIPMFIDRYILFNSIPFYIFIGVFVGWAFNSYLFWRWIVVSALSVKMMLGLEIGNKEFYYREISKSVAKVKELSNPDTYIFLYPGWTDNAFLYYFDQSIFSDPEKKFDLMYQSKVFTIWDHASFRQRVLLDQPRRIILYEDGYFSQEAHRFMDSSYSRIDSVFFPQTTAVTVYDLKVFPADSNLPTTALHNH